MSRLKDLVLGALGRRRRKRRPFTDPLHHNSRENMDCFYGDDDTVERYVDQARLDFYAEVADFIETHGVAINGRRVLDAGCGTGHLLREIQRRYQPQSLTGLDFSEQAVRRTGQFCPDADCRQFDLYQPLAEQFDVVFCLEVLEHLLHPDRALHNLLAATAEQGAVILTVPDGRQDTYEGHLNFWSPESWRVFLDDHAPGFRPAVGLLEDDRVNAAILVRETDTVGS